MLHAFPESHIQPRVARQRIAEDEHAVDNETGLVIEISHCKHVFRLYMLVHRRQFSGNRRFKTYAYFIDTGRAHSFQEFRVPGLIQPDLNSDINIHADRLLIIAQHAAKAQGILVLVSE